MSKATNKRTRNGAKRKPSNARPNKALRLMYTSSRRTRERFFVKLAALVDAGVPVVEASKELESRARRRGETDVEAIILKDVNRRLQRGDPFAEAFQPYATPAELQLIRAGEDGGDMGSGFRIAANVSNSTGKMASAVKAAAAQPVIYILIMIGIIVGLGGSVIPDIAQALDPDSWQGAAAAMYAISQFTRSIWFGVTFALVVALIGVIIASLPRWSGRSRVLFDKIPPWSIYRVVTGSGWLMSVGSMLRAGVTLDDALKRTSQMAHSSGNAYLATRIDEARRRLARGYNIGDALDRAGNKWPDQEIIDDLGVFSRVRNFDERIAALGEEWVERGTARIEGQAKIINTLALLGVAGTVMGFVVAVFSLQQQIMSSVSF